jgi:cytidine deaminase
VEVVNYGCTLCAERTAIVKAVSEGMLAPGGLKTIVVATRTDTPTAPCGSCRQMIEEFAHPEAQILMSHKPGKIALTVKHADLLPFSFNAKSLN